MNRLAELKGRYTDSRLRFHEWMIVILLASMLIWSLFARLDQIAVATGAVIPLGQVKVIQHLEGGIVKTIHVADGDKVSPGVPLIELNLASSGINMKELQARLDGLMLSNARLTSEVGITALVFPAEIEERQPQLAESERMTYETRKREMESSLEVIGRQIISQEQKVAELTTELKAKENDLALANRQLEITENMYKEDLTSELMLLNNRASVEQLNGVIDVGKKKIETGLAQLAEIRMKEAEAKATFSRKAEEQRNEVSKEMASLQEKVTEAANQQVRAEIVSPIVGVVKNLRYNTVGGVVKPGDPIMEIVPTNESLVIEAKLNPVDRGYLAVGQKATVKISAYDFVRYGTLHGTVTQIAADTDRDKERGAYYRVMVQTDTAYLGKTGTNNYPITVGMEAVVDIHTGTQSVFDYLINPILKTRHEAFREP